MAAAGAHAGANVPTVKHVVICPSCAVNTRGSSRAHPCAVDAKHCTSLALPQQSPAIGHRTFIPSISNTDSQWVVMQ
jgi:hypothetical protein